MNTSVLDNNFITNDYMFIAACGRTCADLLDSYNMDRRIPLEVNTGNSLRAKLKSIFLGK